MIANDTWMGVDVGGVKIILCSLSHSSPLVISQNVTDLPRSICAYYYETLTRGMGETEINLYSI